MCRLSFLYWLCLARLATFVLYFVHLNSPGPGRGGGAGPLVVALTAAFTVTIYVGHKRENQTPMAFSGITNILLFRDRGRCFFQLVWLQACARAFFQA